jgi:phospho-N-acetylmuramoyl-pentapeptide-transferase
MLFVAGFVVPLIFVLALYPALITALAKNRVGQHVAGYGPASHAIKSGTPTMGGALFVVAAVIAALAADRGRPGVLIAFALVAGAAIGLVDDIANVRGYKLGLTAVQKLVLQCVAAVLVAIGVGQSGMTHQFGTPGMGAWVIPLAFLAVVACANAVNLTDGVDGLAATCAAVTFAALAIIGMRQGNNTAAFTAWAICGSLVAFLAFNWHPARIFMGDTGSLALGCALVVLSADLRILWLLPLLGIVFVAEALSVIINVTAVKKFNRRIFRASPIHHHFEAIGFGEQRLVLTFALVAANAGALTILIAGTGQ